MKIMSRRSAWLALCFFGMVVSAHAEDVAAGDAALARFDLGAALTAYRAAHIQARDNYEATWKLARALCDQSIYLKDPNEQKRRCIEAEQLTRAAVKLK